jgi:hypothetical protein
MKKIFLSIILFGSLLNACNPMKRETYVLKKGVEAIKTVYDYSGRIVYLDDVVNHLRAIEEEIGIKGSCPVDFPFSISELERHMKYDKIKMIDKYNESLKVLEYLMYVTAYNFEQFKKQNNLEGIEKMKEYFTILKNDFITLLRESVPYAKTQEELYYPMFFSWSQYRRILGTKINFFYNYKIVPKKDKNER